MWFYIFFQNIRQELKINGQDETNFVRIFSADIVWSILLWGFKTLNSGNPYLDEDRVLSNDSDLISMRANKD